MLKFLKKTLKKQSNIEFLLMRNSHKQRNLSSYHDLHRNLILKKDQYQL